MSLEQPLSDLNPQVRWRAWMPSPAGGWRDAAGDRSYERLARSSMAAAFTHSASAKPLQVTLCVGGRLVTYCLPRGRRYISSRRPIVGVVVKHFTSDPNYLTRIRTASLLSRRSSESPRLGQHFPPLAKQYIPTSHDWRYMANGSPVSPPCVRPSTMPLLPLQPTTPRPTTTEVEIITMLQPPQHPLKRQDPPPPTNDPQHHDTRRLRRETPSTAPPPPKQGPQLPASTPNRQAHPIRPQPHRRLHAGPPPLRDLPALRTTHEALLGRRPLGGPDQFDAVSPSSDSDVTPSPLDDLFDGLWGLPYAVGVPEALLARARAVAEAEEAEYQRARGAWRLGGRAASALKEMTTQCVAARGRVVF